MTTSPHSRRDRADDTATTGTTRRSILQGTAALGSVSLLGTATSQLGAADSTTESSQTPTENDVAGLNYALALEHLEHAFYRDGLATFAPAELQHASPLGAFSETVRREVPDYLATIRDHERAHVEAITKTIESLDGAPVGEGNYEFGYETPGEFLELAATFENTGVAAYAGAAPAIKTNDVLSAALSIHTVEARHASLLNLLTGDSPFPTAFDEAQSMSEVLDIAGQFVTNPGDAVSSESPTSKATPERASDDGTSDVDVLQFALTLEHLEYAFYRDGLEHFSDCELENAVYCRFGDAVVTDSVVERLEAIRDHEQAHVETIRETVSKLGGAPVEEATYSFGYETANEFIDLAQTLENTGVAAYLGAGTTVTSDAVFEAAASIQSVEARHAGFLNELTGTTPSPDSFYSPKSMSEIKQIAGQFIESQ